MSQAVAVAPARSRAASSPSTAQRTAWVWAACAVLATLLGVALRIEHTLTFAPMRGHDYRVYTEGIRWVAQHGRTFDASVPIQVGCQPPLWYLLGALLLKLGFSLHAAALGASLVVVGWLVRQGVLALMLWRIAPGWRASTAIALGLHAVVPLGVLMDGVANPEGLHATLFFVALYLLFRCEQDARTPRGVSVVRALAFGVVAGLAFLAKATGIGLMMVAGVVFAWAGFARARERGWREAARRIALPALLAAGAWVAVTAWWTLPNLHKFRHPFPHIYMVNYAQMAEEHPILHEPVLNRRPLGWFLPLDLEYVWHPLATSPDSPRANFWAPIVSGTWADFTNRGFCRNAHSTLIETVWYGPVYLTSARCVALAITLVRVGIWLTLAGVAAVALELWRAARSRGREGSAAVALAICAAVGFTMSFAATFPFDMYEVVKPNYLAVIVTPMCACLGFLLLRREERAGGRPARLHALVALGTVLIAALLVAERAPRPRADDGPHHGVTPG